MCFLTKTYNSYFLHSRIASQAIAAGREAGSAYRAIMCGQPCPASLASRRKQAESLTWAVRTMAYSNNLQHRSTWRTHLLDFELTTLLLSAHHQLDSCDLHALREEAAVRYLQPAPRPQALLLPAPLIHTYTIRCDSYTLQAMGGSDGPKT
jgi:hypothetical protein